MTIQLDGIITAKDLDTESFSFDESLKKIGIKSGIKGAALNNSDLVITLQDDKTIVVPLAGLSVGTVVDKFLKEVVYDDVGKKFKFTVASSDGVPDTIIETPVEDLMKVITSTGISGDGTATSPLTLDTSVITDLIRNAITNAITNDVPPVVNNVVQTTVQTMIDDAVANIDTSTKPYDITEVTRVGNITTTDIKTNRKIYRCIGADEKYFAVTKLDNSVKGCHCTIRQAGTGNINFNLGIGVELNGTPNLTDIASACVLVYAGDGVYDVYGI